MFKEIFEQIKTASIMLIVLTILTGIIYPLFVTGIGQLIFPWKANGSLIIRNNQTVGSELIGQSFNALQYFWSRPSATSPFPYNGASSTGSNMGPSNPDFLAIIKDRTNQLQQSDPSHQTIVPVDLVTASGSGLDPEISPLAAYYQVPRIAKIRHIPEENLKNLIQNLIQKRFLGIIGEPRINVLQLNLAVDQEFLK